MMKSRLDIDLKKMYINKENAKPIQQVKPPQVDIPVKKPEPAKTPLEPAKFFEPTPPRSYAHLTNSLNYYRL